MVFQRIHAGSYQGQYLVRVGKHITHNPFQPIHLRIFFIAKIDIFLPDIFLPKNRSS